MIVDRKTNGNKNQFTSINLSQSKFSQIKQEKSNRSSTCRSLNNACNSFQESHIIVDRNG